MAGCNQESSSNNNILESQSSASQKVKTIKVPSPIEAKQVGDGNAAGNLGNSYRPVSCDGQWIYFVINDCIYRVGNNNSEKFIVYKNTNGDSLTDINVIGKWIYFIVNGKSGDQLNRINTDGSQLEHLIIKSKDFDDIKAIKIINNRLYLEDMGSGINEIHLDTLSVTNHWDYVERTTFQVSKDAIYVDGGHPLNGMTARIKMDGERTSQEIIIPEYIGGSFRIDGEDLYYWGTAFGFKADHDYKYDEPDTSNLERGLYRSNLDGSECTLISKDVSDNFVITNEWIFYTDKNNDLYRMKKNSAEKEMIYKQLRDNYQQFTGELNIAGSWIYYRKSEEYDQVGELWRVSIDGKINEKVN